MTRGRRTARACVRGSGVVLHLLLGLALAFAAALDGGRRLSVDRLARGWTRALLAILDVQVVVRGSGVRGPRVVVANHVSWLDIPVLASVECSRFVAKSEIRRWPIIGWLARSLGTFFIHRGKGGAQPVLDDCVPHLRAGGAFVFFPEGTTTDGTQVGRFHARLFAAAIEAQAPVQPLALRYGRAADGANVAAFVGDDALVPHIVRLLREPGLVVEVIYAGALPSRGRDRESLAVGARRAVSAALAPSAPLARAA